MCRWFNAQAGPVGFVTTGTTSYAKSAASSTASTIGRSPESGTLNSCRTDLSAIFGPPLFYVRKELGETHEVSVGLYEYVMVLLHFLSASEIL
jgi:hypothetical protein